MADEPIARAAGAGARAAPDAAPGLVGRLFGVLMERLNERAYRHAAAVLAPGPGERLLEIGFGTGRFVEILLAAAPDVEVAAPPHAPAHGYRRHHASGVDLRFDRQLGVYVVVGHAGVYFSDDWFIRWYGGRWQFSRRVGGPWEVQPADRVPRGLRAKYRGKSPKAHGYGPAKAGW